MHFSVNRDCERLAGSLVSGLRMELYLTPKPGLVDLVDNGSHRDLSVALMERSIERVAGGFREVTRSLGRGEPLRQQVDLGRETERRMLDEFSANTHRGALFLGGLLLVARSRTAVVDGPALQGAVSLVARELFAGREAQGSHGDAARQEFGVGGIVGEAMAGLPSLFETAVPSFLAEFRVRGDFYMASFAMLGALMQTAEDTTALHRCGRSGLARLRRDGRSLEQMVARNVDPAPFLRECNDDYRGIGLTMGGVADLLGIAYGWLVYRGHLGIGARGGDRTRTAYSASGF
jgi:triphosphoribosyl-dephospho-CoA synthase